MTEEMNLCTFPDPCFFREDGKCSKDFGLECPHEEKPQRMEETTI
jgi:hypothetical protein